jgi:hypothetical protein
MLTYTTLDGLVLDLTNLTDEERDYFDRSYEAYHADISWGRFNNLVAGPRNPLVRAAGGRVTHAVWDHPLYQALRDLDDRLGIRLGEVAPSEGDDLDSDPLVDEFVSVAEAARRQGVTVKAAHKAIERGDIVAGPAMPGGKRMQVSVNSLARWTPDPARQRAGRMAAEKRAGYATRRA